MGQTSSNAVLSKARALYGQRLRFEDWMALLDCSSVNDIATYLKAHTVYRSVLVSIDEFHIHRGQLEACLRERLFSESAKLARYDLDLGEHVSAYLLQKLEIQMILRCITRLNSGQMEDPFFLIPESAAHQTEIDEKALHTLSSYDQLLHALSHTQYEKILLSFAPKNPEEQIDYTGIESALWIDLMRRLYQVIYKETKGQTREELLRIFDDYIDLSNYSRIIRLKRTYHADPDQIKSLLLPFGSLKKETLDRMAAAESEKEVAEIMQTTRVGKRTLSTPHKDPDDLIFYIEYHDCRKKIRFSPNPSVVLFSYVFLLQSELHDLTTLIEGVRYQLQKAEIQNLLNPERFSGRSS